MKGKFITFEGAEGSGKSTQAHLVEQELIKRGKDVLLIREPGGVKISESIRDILLDVANTAMTNESEVLLYMAARAQLVKEVIAPALDEGKIVLCDRFLDSTVVYQGYGHDMDMKVIEAIGAFATKGIAPDLTLLFDIEVEKGLSRTGAQKDRIEQRSVAYHNRVREGYLQLAKDHPERIHIIEVDAEKEVIYERVSPYIDALLGV